MDLDPYSKCGSVFSNFSKYGTIKLKAKRWKIEDKNSPIKVRTSNDYEYKTTLYIAELLYFFGM